MSAMVSVVMTVELNFLFIFLIYIFSSPYNQYHINGYYHQSILYYIYIFFFTYQTKLYGKILYQYVQSNSLDKAMLIPNLVNTSRNVLYYLTN